MTENVAFEDLREDVSSPATKKRKPVLAADEDIQIDEKSNKNRNRDEIDNITVHSPTKVNTSMSPPQRVSSTSARKSSRSSRSPPQDVVRQTVTSETVLVLETGNISAKTRTETTKSDSQISHTSKAYYPKINYDPSQSEVIASILSSNLTHKDILLKVVADICHIESLGLKSYSDENKGRESLIFALQEILRTLPDEISVATADTIVFSPELNTDEKIEVESLERAVTALKQQSIALERYENNISELGKKYGLWIDGIPKSATTTVSTSIPSGQVSSTVIFEIPLLSLRCFDDTVYVLPARTEIFRSYHKSEILFLLSVCHSILRLYFPKP